MAQINGNLSVVGEVLGLKLEKLAADPTGGGLVESRVWYNTVTKALKLYNGTEAVSIGGGLTQEELETALVPYAQTSDVNTAISNAVQDLVSGTEMQGAIDNALAGLDFQEDVLGLESDFTNVAGRYIYVDGTTFATGVAAAAGDIVVVDAAGVITANAYDVSDAGPGALVWNRETVNFFRWNGTNWAEFGGLVGFTAGDGLEKVGDVVSVKASNASIVVAAGGISVGDLSATYVTPAALATATENFITETDIEPVAAVVNNLQIQVGGSYYTSTTVAAAVEHTFTHAIGVRWPLVQVVDKATNKVIIPDEIEFTSTTQFVVRLGTAIDVIVTAYALQPAA